MRLIPGVDYRVFWVPFPPDSGEPEAIRATQYIFPAGETVGET